MSAHTRGPWRDSDGYGAIVADGDTGYDDADNLRGYGGHLVCESVAPRNRPLLRHAPDLWDVVEELVREGLHRNECLGGDPCVCVIGKAKAVMDKINE